MLNSLQINNFRLLRDFAVPHLGRVNLIVGKNNSGKSSVLEALRIFAGNANRKLLEKIAREHDEKMGFVGSEPYEEEPTLPFEAFFSGRQYPQDENTEIFIGESRNDKQALRIKHGYLKETEEIVVDEDGDEVTRTTRTPVSRSELNSLPEEIISQALFIVKAERQYRLRFDMSSSRVTTTVNDIPITIPCSVVPTQFVTIEELAEEWDKIVLTEYQTFVRDALKIVEEGVEDLAFVKEIDRLQPRRGRSAKVKLSSAKRPVPLNSMVIL